MCWYCEHGLPKAVQAIYDRYRAIAGWLLMDCGPAHVVWGDFNLDTDSIQWCLDNFDRFRREDGTDEEHKAVRDSLVELLKIPESERDPAPPEEWEKD